MQIRSKKMLGVYEDSSQERYCLNEQKEGNVRIPTPQYFFNFKKFKQLYG